MSIQIITIETICENTNEGNTLELSCEGGHIIYEILFSSYENPKGKCGCFSKALWDVTKNNQLVGKACIGMKSCTINVSAMTFGVDSVNNLSAKLAI